MRNYFPVYGTWSAFRQFTDHHVYGTSFVTNTDNFEKTFRIFSEIFYSVMQMSP